MRRPSELPTPGDERRKPMDGWRRADPASVQGGPQIYADRLWAGCHFLYLRLSLKSADHSSLRAVYIVIFCFPPNWSGGTFTGSFDLLLSTDAANGTIHYTLDGTHPIGPLPVAIAQAVFIVHHELGD